MRSWLEQRRKGKGYTNHEQIAKDVGIDRSYYTKIEAGLTPSVKVAKQIAAVLDFEWTLFFDDDCAKSEQKTTSA